MIDLLCVASCAIAAALLTTIAINQENESNYDHALAVLSVAFLQLFFRFVQLLWIIVQTYFEMQQMRRDNNHDSDGSTKAQCHAQTIIATFDIVYAQFELFTDGMKFLQILCSCSTLVQLAFYHISYCCYYNFQSFYACVFIAINFIVYLQVFTYDSNCIQTVVVA